MKEIIEYVKTTQKAALHGLYARLEKDEIDLVILIYAGYSQSDIANHFQTYQRDISRRFKKIKEKLCEVV